MKVYVAAPYADHETVRRAMDVLRGQGHTITFDWTHAVEEHPFESSGSEDYKREQARRDLDGAMEADAVLVIASGDKTKGCGMWIEMGAALALGRTVIVCGEGRDRSIFSLLATHVVPTVKDALVLLAP